MSLEKHLVVERGLDIPDRVRLAVLDRDNHQCQNCGTGGDNRLQLHHVIYRSQGGSNEQENLVTLCFRCHEGVHQGVYVFDLVEGSDGELQVFPRRRVR